MRYSYLNSIGARAGEVLDDEVNGLIGAVKGPKDYLRSRPDIFENQYDTTGNEIDRKYREARKAWYQYAKPGPRHIIEGGIRAAGAYSSSGRYPYPPDLIAKYFRERQRATGEHIIGHNDRMLNALMDRNFEIFIKREVIETAEAFLRQAYTRLTEANNMAVQVRELERDRRARELEEDSQLIVVEEDS
jgi:hypothetical protein